MSETKTASLSACLTAFNCADGGCVDLTARCDGRADCSDSTDELGCDSLMPLKVWCPKRKSISFLLLEKEAAIFLQFKQNVSNIYCKKTQGRDTHCELLCLL